MLSNGIRVRTGEWLLLGNHFEVLEGQSLPWQKHEETPRPSVRVSEEAEDPILAPLPLGTKS